MSMTIADVKSNLTAQLHGGTLNKVRNIELALERAANTMLSKLDIEETIQIAPLTSTIHDDIYNYALPSDFNKIIDLYPEDNRNFRDAAKRVYSQQFDLRKMLARREIVIEGRNGLKTIRINWRNRAGKVLSTLDDVDDNGTWTAVGTATNIKQDSITKLSGKGSVRFDVVTSGDGIQNTTLEAVDMTDEDEVADVFFSFYIQNEAALANLTSVTPVWGNDLSTAYWTGVAQIVQADGTPFKIGWNIIRVPWSTATESGIVDPTSITAAKLTFATLGPIPNIRVENIIFSIGRSFDIKYYGKYVVKNSSGILIPRTTSDDDTVIFDNDTIQIFLLEAHIACAHQCEGSDSGFDISWAQGELNGTPNSPDPAQRIGLYARYRADHPSQVQKPVTSYSGLPIRRRW